MPLLLENAVRFPVVFEPWYVYEATLDASPQSFQVFDILVSDAAGTFDLPANATPVVIIAGYVIALEKFVTGMTTVQVAVPGSAIPAIAEVDIQPCELVLLNQTTLVQTIAPAVGASFAAGAVLGRLGNHHADHQNLRLTAANDIVIIRTGVC